MRIILCSLLGLFTFSGLLGYTHTIKLTKRMQDARGTYKVVFDQRADTWFEFVVKSDRTITIGTQRNVEATVSRKRRIQVASTNPDEVCIMQLAVMDESKKLAPTTMRFKPFRTSSAGASYCGEYMVRLTVDGNALKLEDRTPYAAAE